MHDRKQNVIDAINHRTPRRMPYTLEWEGDVAERVDAYYGSDAWRQKVRSSIMRFGGMKDGRGGDEALCRDAYGSLWRQDRRPFHLEEPALKEPSLRSFRFPEMDVLFPDGWDREAREGMARYEDCLKVVGFGFGLFERSWALRGFVDMLTDAAAEPAFFEDFIAAIAAHQEAILDRLMELPAEGVMFSDDWGDQRGIIVGPERWRSVLKPHLRRMYAKVKARGKLVLTHCCGSIVDIMPDVIEIGLDVVQSVQPEARGMNPYDLKARWGDRITFWGGLGSQSTIPFGTPDEIRDEIRKLATEMGRDGGYVLGCAKALQPETPTENAVAVIEEFLAVAEDGTEGE